MNAQNSATESMSGNAGRIHQARSDRAPRLLLWSIAAATAALSLAAAGLWAVNGPAYLLDLIATYCF